MTDDAIREARPEALAEPLLEFLRSEFGDCSYAEPPVLLAPGNETLICAFRLQGPAPPLDQPLILRLFDAGSDPEHVLGEAAIQNAIADQGFPAARAFAICRSDNVLGGPFFVMQRLPGSTFLSDCLELDRSGTPRMLPWAVLRQGLAMLTEMPRKLAAVDIRMHALDVARVIAALDDAHVPWRTRTIESLLQTIAERVESSSADGLRVGVEWLQTHLPRSVHPVVLCHGDMHPLNLMVDAGQVCGVLDWSNALLAPAECEIGWTRATFLTIPLPVPALLRPATRRIAATIANGYQRAYQRSCSRTLDEDAVRYHEAFHDLMVLSEMTRRAARGEVKRDAFNSPRALAKLADHFSSITGKSVAVPRAA